MSTPPIASVATESVPLVMPILVGQQQNRTVLFFCFFYHRSLYNLVTLPDKWHPGTQLFKAFVVSFFLR